MPIIAVLSENNGVLSFLDLIYAVVVTCCCVLSWLLWLEWERRASLRKECLPWFLELPPRTDRFFKWKAVGVLIACLLVVVAGKLDLEVV